MAGLHQSTEHDQDHSFLSLIFLAHHLSSFSSPLSLQPTSSSLLLPPPPPPPPPPPQSPPQRPTERGAVLERMGIVDENGFMVNDFKVGNIDPKSVDELIDNMTRREKERRDEIRVRVRVRVQSYEVCDVKMMDYIPCLDNVDGVSRLNYGEKGEKFERHCPEKGKELNCLVPAPNGYHPSIPWPQSRDEVWFSNVPHTHLVEDKGGQNWISIKGDKFLFPGDGTQFIRGADQYLDQISQMVPDIKLGQNIRVALDVGCGVASFGAFVTARGVPAMVAVFAAHRLLYPSQAFDFIHCSRCRINWTLDDGILLLEANRMLRAGGYFIWAAQPVYKHEDVLQEQWREMENVTSRICWELVKKEGYIAIWRKPVNNSCYLNREVGAWPPLCDPSDDPDIVWHVNLKACITKLPDNGCGATVSTWPERLHNPPDRLQSIQMDAYLSRKEIYKAESKYWKDIIESYVRAFHWKDKLIRNVMDMRAGFGGFAAALHDVQIDCWVMSVVPVSEYNTLPVIYDRGLVGVMHDWCEPFDTYPRTYDLLHAAGLFSIERKRCNLSSIMLEMDRILRPNGLVYIRDSITIMDELQEIASAMRWACLRFDTGEGPHASWKILRCDKRR